MKKYFYKILPVLILFIVTLALLSGCVSTSVRGGKETTPKVEAERYCKNVFNDPEFYSYCLAGVALYNANAKSCEKIQNEAMKEACTLAASKGTFQFREYQESKGGFSNIEASKKCKQICGEGAILPTYNNGSATVISCYCLGKDDYQKYKQLRTGQ